MSGLEIFDGCSQTFSITDYILVLGSVFLLSLKLNLELEMDKKRDGWKPGPD